MTMENTVRVLLIDDDLADRELARLALSRANVGVFDVEISTCLTEAEPHLRSDKYDVLLLDLGLPESFGNDTLDRVRAINKTIPIVVLTDLCDEQKAMECLETGAQDYIFKSDMVLETLSRSVRYAIQRQQLREELSFANAQLEQKNDELARLCETAQRFVDNVSHEFRTPLTVITEYVSLLLDGVVGNVELDADQKHFLSILGDRANDLNTMVDDMLDVSKLQAGLLSTWRKVNHLPDILQHLRPALNSKAAIKNVELVFEIDDTLPAIYCDGEKLGRVLINLVVNAIKFGGTPGKVVVSAHENQSRNEVMISVTDNGPGISPEDREMIFGRFRQLDAHVHQPQKGFGLGLSIAKELVDLNLGEMSLESELDQGSTFSFTVPIDNPVEVTRRYIRQLQTSAGDEMQLAIIEVEIPCELEAVRVEEVDAFLNYVLRPEDVLFRCEQRWLFLAPMKQMETSQYVTGIQDALVETNKNRAVSLIPDLTIHEVGQWELANSNLLLNQLSQILGRSEVAYV